MSKTDQFWDEYAETLSRSQLEALQLERLQHTLRQVSSSELYRKKYAEAGISPATITCLQDVQKLPFTAKQDLRDHYPYGLLCMPKNQFVRLHASSGTTGQSIAVLYTRADLETWADLLARCMYMTGARPGDTFQNLAGYGLFTGGLGFQYGAERLGLLSIPAGSGGSKRQIQLMRDFSTSIIHIIPSYALRLMDVMMELGVDPKKELQLRLGYLGAEPYAEEVRRRVEEFYGIRVFNSYGLSEMNGPGVAFECPYQSGMHVWEDAYLVEIIDPDTLGPVPEGVSGELVLTTLKREGMPVIRYRTRDITRIIPGECRCGRAHKRLDRIQGRSDDMFIIKGVNIFPMQVERVLMNIPEVGNCYVIILERQHDVDDMIVRVEVNEKMFVEDMRHLQRLQQKITRDLRGELQITPRVDLVEPNTLPRSEGKAMRLIDRRDL